MKKIFLLLLVNAVAGFAVANETIPRLRLPQMNAPTIDGKIESAEWQLAGEQFGCLSYNTPFLAHRRATFFIGYDRENFYFACRSELPPEGQRLMSRVRRDGTMVATDDAVEIHLYPPEGKYTYQILLNGRNAKFTGKYEVMSGAVIHKSKTFSPRIQSASSYRNGYWEIEVKIPLSELENATITPGKPWKVQMVRSFRNPADGCSWSKTLIFCDVANMGIITPDNDVPVVSFCGLGDEYDKGKYSIRFRVFNPTSSPRKVRSMVTVKSTAAPRIMAEEKIIQPGQSEEFVLQYTELAPFEYEFDAIFTDLTAGKELFARKFYWRPVPAQRWISRSQQQNNATLEIGYYPYLGIVKARYGSPDLRASSQIDRVEFVIENSQSQVVGSPLPGVRNRFGFTAQWNSGRLPEGDYRVRADIYWKDGRKESVSKNFVDRRFEWENLGIGTERVIVPPFVPLRTDADTQEIHALQTGYRSANGFWSAIYAKGENILAAPITLTLNGSDNFFTQQQFRFTETSPDRVVSETVLAGNGLQLTVVNEYDYDGMCKTTLQFIPQGIFDARSMYIEIPIKGEYAKLYHCVNDVPRYHPTDFLPTDQGVLWNSMMGKKHPHVSGNFWPYVWIGEIYRGVCWFAPNDRNWSLDHAKPALEIIRRENAVVLRINLVNMPVKWDKPFEIVLGFQPTPVKPLPQNWQALYDRGKPAPHAIAFSMVGGSTCWGNAGACDPWPVDRDYSFIERLAPGSRKTVTPQMIDEYLVRHRGSIPPARYQRLQRDMNRSRIMGRYSDYFYPYINPRAADSRWIEYQVFQNEWFYSEYRTQIDYDEYNMESTASHQDMLLFYMRLMVRSGMDGLYYDNVRLRATYDPTRGPAYELPNGRIQPYFDIFSFRQLIKRTATMLYLENKVFMDGRPLLDLHMTNGAIIPFLSFGTVQLDCESEYGPTEFHDRFSEGYLLAETIGTQAGCIPQILNLVTGNNQRWIGRTFLCRMLAIDLPMCLWQTNYDSIFTETWQRVYQFGYGSPQVTVYPSWNVDNPVRCAAENIRISSYIRQDRHETMIAVCDFGNNENGGEYEIDLSALGYPAYSVTDAESGVALGVADGKVKLTLPRRDFRLLIIKGE